MAQIETISTAPAGAQRCREPVAQFEPLGRWMPVELVAEGPISCVYRARVVRDGVGDNADGAGGEVCVESADGRPAMYAVKVLCESWRGDAKAVAVMCREVQAARTVRHPNVISVLAAGLQGPPYYIVMPWLHGRTLGARLADSRALDLPVALWIVRQVAEALDGMQAAGWMHGDVKPSNVFISPEGHVTLLDLGFARSVNKAGGVDAMRGADAVDRRHFMGSGSYLAPESACSTLAADIRSDIYSLGVVLFEMLTGRLPFMGDDLAAVLHAHRIAAAPNPRSFAPEIPLEVMRLVRQMLCKEPLRRPQTPRELVGRLSELEIRSFGERTVAGVC